MKKRSLQAYGPRNSAPYVAMHGFYQIKRGRRPSMSFGGVKNPEDAYRAAVALCVVNSKAEGLYSYPTSRLSFTRVSRNVFQVDYLYGTIDAAYSMLHVMAVAMQGGTVTINGINVPCDRAVFQVNFNGVIMRVDATSDRQAFLRDYSRADGGRIPQPAGPRYKLELSDRELAVERAHQAKLEDGWRTRSGNKAQKMRRHRLRYAAGREFDLMDVMSVTTGVVLRGVSGLYDVLDFMYGDDGRGAGPQCRRALIEQHPWQATVESPKDLTMDQLKAWMAQQVAEHGEKILVKPLPPQ